MNLIFPAEISGKIMTLIDQSKELLIIVSPYNKIENWKKLNQRILKAQNRGVKIKWFIRSKVQNNAEQIIKLGIKPIEIDNLHCKIYLNEKNAVVSSMNLHEFSDSSSIDIGYFVDDSEKYNELRDFIDNYLEPLNENIKLKFSYNDKTDFYNNLRSYLTKYSKLFQGIILYDSQYGKSISIVKFLNHFILIFETKSSYFRIDLRIDLPYKQKKNVYNFLTSLRNVFELSFDHTVGFGSQMKRLKVDLRVFENYEYQNWGEKEFDILKPYIDRIIKVYKEEILNKNIVEQLSI